MKISESTGDKWNDGKPLTFNSLAYLSILVWSFNTIASQKWHSDKRTLSGRCSYSPWSNNTSWVLPLLLSRLKNTKIYKKAM